MLTDELREKYREIAAFVKAKCLQDCYRLYTSDGDIGSCCSYMYCDLAIENARKDGVLIKPLHSNGTHHDYCGPDGCIIPPEYRPLCSVHICERFLLDSKFKKDYLTLRKKIEDLEDLYFLKGSANVLK